MSYPKPVNRWTAGAAFFLLAAVPLHAGVVFEIEVKDHAQSPPTTESIQAAVEGRNLKMGIASGGKDGQGDMIFRGDRRKIMFVDNDNRSYTVVDETGVRKVAGQVNAAIEQLEEMLANVPADRRAMIEEMMKKNLPAAQPTRARPELKKTGERAEKSGYPCVKYEVFTSGQKVRELWVTDWSNVEGGSDVVDAFEDMADFFREMLDAMPNMAGGGGPGFGDSAFEHMKEIGGFPVVTREFGDDGLLRRENSLRSARRQMLDPDAFEPPSGYKRQEMFSGGF